MYDVDVNYKRVENKAFLMGTFLDYKAKETILKFNILTLKIGQIVSQEQFIFSPGQLMKKRKQFWEKMGWVETVFQRQGP